jgi:hypothetical protein
MRTLMMFVGKTASAGVNLADVLVVVRCRVVHNQPVQTVEHHYGLSVSSKRLAGNKRSRPCGELATTGSARAYDVKV